MIQLTNCPPPLRITCSILLVEAKHMDATKAKPNTEGYIRRISFIPGIKTSHPAQEKCKTATKEEQGITDGTSCRECPIIGINLFHV